MDYQIPIQSAAYSIPSENQSVTMSWIQKLFTDVIENPIADEEIIAQYFSPDFIQRVDGKTHAYADFVQHVKALKASVRFLKVTIERCLIQGNSFCTIHCLNGVKKNGEVIEARVIAYFQVEDGKLTLCDELTKILKGNKEDEDLGSIK